MGEINDEMLPDEVTMGVGEDTIGIAPEIDDEEISMLDESLAGVEAYDYDAINFAHWLFERDRLLRGLSILGSAIKNMSELLSKVVRMKQVNGLIEFTINTGDILARVSVPLLNSENILDKEYIVDFKSLFMLVRNSGDKLFIRDKDNFPAVYVLGGEAEIEHYNLDTTSFDWQCFTDKDNIKTLSSVEFLKVLSNITLSMSLARRPEDNRVRIEDGLACSNFMYAFCAQTCVGFEGVSLRALDAVILQKLLADSAGFEFTELPKAYAFRTVNACVVIPKIDTNNLKGLYKAVEKPDDTEGWMHISCHYMYKIVTLIKDMIGGVGNVKVLAEDGRMSVKALTRTGRVLMFPVSAVPKDVTFTITMQVVPLACILAMYKDAASVRIITDSKGTLTFKSESMWVALAGMYDGESNR